ncbi:MAG: ABC transporter substrate-binding protein [Treponema sp.]|jgi:ABC-type glycerol-3-phosphate transport system substrate-binding protein|nr:ABC transporter substrate-binding protein [Treponema sp.]
MKYVIRMLALLLLSLMSISCGKSGGAAASGSFSSTDPIYAGYNLNDPLTLYVYMVGDTPKGLEEVVAKANEEYFKPVLNTTIEVVFIAWGDLATKYALILSSGEDVDLMFTAGWCYYEQEATKGSFLEITEDFRKQWLPATFNTLPQTAWLQMLSKGKVYAIPQNLSQWDGYKYLVLREDLRTKYRLPEPNTWAALENYLFTIAKNEPAIQAFAAASNTAEILYVFWQDRDIQMTADYNFCWDGTGKKEPSPEDLNFFFMTDWWLDYALEMAEWADNNVWSKNVLNNTIAPQDSFIQGKSATLFWNMTVFTAGQSMENTGVGTAGYYDITADKPVRLSGYANNAFAIASASKHPERTALALDLMKNNEGLRNLLQGGIDGRHYINNGDGTYVPGPEAEDYGFNAWAWALNSPHTLELADPNAPAKREPIIANQRSRVWEPLIDGFRLDSTPITTEWAVISALLEEYSASFQCGAFGKETRAKMDEFRGKLKAAGIDKIIQEYRSQYAAFLAKYGN